MTQLKWTFWFLASLQWLLRLQAPIFSCKDFSLSHSCKYLNISHLVISLESICYLHHLLQTSATHKVQITENKPKLVTKSVPLASWFLLLHCLNTTKIYNSDKIASWDNTLFAVKLYSFPELKVIVLGISDETLKMKCGDGNCCSNYVHEITFSHVLSMEDSGIRNMTFYHLF